MPIQPFLLRAIENSQRYGMRLDQRDSSINADSPAAGQTSSVPRIKIVGAGSAGTNMISRLDRLKPHGAETVAVDMDKLHLDYVTADRKVKLPVPLHRGFSCACHPELGVAATEAARDVIREALAGADLIIVLAGMGGSTGTGAAGVISDIARVHGATVICIVTRPSKVEGPRRLAADKQIISLQKKANLVVVADFQKLLEEAVDLEYLKIFSAMDNLIAATVRDFIAAITRRSLKSVDAREQEAMQERGAGASMQIVEAPPEEVVKAVFSQLLSDARPGHAPIMALMTGVEEDLDS